MNSIGMPELVIILVIIALLFGVGRISQVGKELGSAISAFRQGMNEGSQEEKAAEAKEAPKDPPLDTAKTP